jgi:hypothetical protein
MSRKNERDPALERAVEEAEGIEAIERTGDGALEREREDAQGIEVFEDPDATIPATALAEGAPGEQTFSGDAVGSAPDPDDDRARSD